MANKVGGVAVDVLKAGATTAVVGTATAIVADKVIEKTGVDKKLKSGVNALIKGASKWFK